jgi:thiol-disulfide isomerase/thioredoxin
MTRESFVSRTPPLSRRRSSTESIRMAARGEDPPVVFGLQPYYPVNDFIGSKFADIILPDYKTGEDLKLSDHVNPGRLTAILYWGSHCPYSRKVMPAVVLASRNFHEKYLDVISVVRMKSGETQEDVGKYAAETGIPFPILQDRGHRFTNAYRVTSTPTLIVIRPDGILDSVYTSSTANFFAVLMTKINALVVKPVAPPTQDPHSPKKPASRR